MSRGTKRYVDSQAGFTLVELMITLLIATFVMTALTSVIFTAVKVSDLASSRIETTAQIRSFQFFAYDDFSRSQVRNGATCTRQNPCTTQPIVLVGTQVSNNQPPVPASLQVTYIWDSSNQFVERQVSPTGPFNHAATDVSAFSWYIDQTPWSTTVVVSMTVTVKGYGESQTLKYQLRTS